MALRALLLDCFGTLVEYDAGRTTQGYDQTYLYLRDIGFAGAYESFLSTYEVMGEAIEAQARTTNVEYSMSLLASTYLAMYGLAVDDDTVDGFVDRYLDEWRNGISSIPGVEPLLAKLHDEYSIVVVTNTHDEWLPGSVLEQFGLATHIDAIVTSVEHGRRKPDPTIYAKALDVAGVEPSEALFVGDSVDADFVGPTAFGIPAVLIDPAGEADVDPQRRLSSFVDLGSYLGA